MVARQEPAKPARARLERLVASIPDAVLLDGPFNCLECGIPEVTAVRAWLVEALLAAPRGG